MLKIASAMTLFLASSGCRRRLRRWRRSRLPSTMPSVKQWRSRERRWTTTMSPRTKRPKLAKTLPRLTPAGR
eukprot:7005727-Prymnesium_polylepis.1